MQIFLGLYSLNQCYDIDLNCFFSGERCGPWASCLNFSVINGSITLSCVYTCISMCSCVLSTIFAVLPIFLWNWQVLKKDLHTYIFRRSAQYPFYCSPVLTMFDIIEQTDTLLYIFPHRIERVHHILDT